MKKTGTNKKANYIDAFYGITKDSLFDFAVRIFMSRNLTREEAYQKIYDLGQAIKEEKRQQYLAKRKEKKTRVMDTMEQERKNDQLQRKKEK